MPRLRRSDTSAPGFTRKRSGRGFSYRDERGERITDSEVRTRIASLAIPPAWNDVWVSPHAHGHIQATGVDAAGRRQYLYHPAWREQKDRIKFDRALELAATLPAARRRVTFDLRRPRPDRTRALAAAFRMIDTAHLRIGSEQYAETHGSIGLCTLLCSHAHVSNDTIALEFPGKSGQAWAVTVRDGDLASVVRGLKRRGPNARLLAYREGEHWHPLAPAQVNDYVRDATGEDFTAKDFRTLHGTTTAAAALVRIGARATVSGRKRAIAEAMRAAAAELGNTPAIARSSYVDPRILDLYRGGTTVDVAHRRSLEAQLRELLAD